MYDNNAYTTKERKEMTTPPWYAAIYNLQLIIVVPVLLNI